MIPTYSETKRLMDRSQPLTRDEIMALEGDALSIAVNARVAGYRELVTGWMRPHESRDSLAEIEKIAGIDVQFRYAALLQQEVAHLPNPAAQWLGIRMMDPATCCRLLLLAAVRAGEEEKDGE